MRTWPALLFVRPVSPKLGTSEGGSRTDLLQAALTDYDVSALDEPSPGSLRAFFHESAERDRALAGLRTDFPDFEVSSVDVPDEDWAARSQANLKSIQVGRIVVSPPWDTEEVRLAFDSAQATPSESRGVKADPTMTIVIQPSMGFGTGHHATTRLCLAALQRANVRGRSVIDVGTGSGVLAIAASLLGASPVIGLDDDPDAIQSAQENLDLNPQARVDLRAGDLRAAVLGIADVVVANLTGTLLIQAAPQLQALIAPHGRLIASGLLDQEEAAVIAAFGERAVLDRTHEDEWVCLVLGSRRLLE